MKIIYAITLLAFISSANRAIAQTTVTNGNWSSPLTWGGVPPMGNGTVVINHNVTLDIDYSQSSGSITIGAAGSINGNSPMRVFALNYPSGTASLTVNGAFNVSRVPLNTGTVINNGVFQSDSLLNSSSISNSGDATINAMQFMNNTGGTINNNGSIISVNFLNIASVSNNGSISSNDFTNSKSFTNTATGYINITHDFSNIDTLTSPAIFTNNGDVIVAHNWHNGNQIDGSGNFCIGNNTWNSGVMNGTFDFCDQTGGSIDLNTGSFVSASITYCANSCNAGVSETPDAAIINICPNPFTTETTIQSDKILTNATLTVYNCFGQLVKQINGISGHSVTLLRDNLSNGLYFIYLTQGNKVISTHKLIIIGK